MKTITLAIALLVLLAPACSGPKTPPKQPTKLVEAIDNATPKEMKKAEEIFNKWKASLYNK